MPPVSGSAGHLTLDRLGHGERTVTERAALGQPFHTVEDAWFWTMAALIARRDGARYTAGKGAVERPCTPDDIIKCLDTLYRQRRIDLTHARVLRIWGERQTSPSLRCAAERREAEIWREALDRLEWHLRAKAIIV